MVCETKLHTWPFFNVLNWQTDEKTWLLRLNLQTKLLTSRLRNMRMCIHRGALCTLFPFRVPAFRLSQLPKSTSNFFLQWYTCIDKRDLDPFMSYLFGRVWLSSLERMVAVVRRAHLSLAWPDPSRSRKRVTRGSRKGKKGLVTLNRMPFHNGM